jgi:hypothetical protein
MTTCASRLVPAVRTKKETNASSIEKQFVRKIMLSYDPNSVSQEKGRLLMERSGGPSPVLVVVYSPSFMTSGIRAGFRFVFFDVVDDEV